MKAILLIAVLATALATNFAQFEAIEKSELGKTLLNTIALELSQGSPVEHLFDLLYDIEHRYQNDQKEDDDKNRAFQARCDDDLAGLSDDIAQSERKSADLQASIDELVPIRDQKVGQKTAKVKGKADLQKVIDDATNERTNQTNDFEQKREEFEFVSSVLAAARRLFTENLQAPSGFLQTSSEKVHFTPQIMAQVGTHLSTNAAKINKMKFVKAYGKAIKLLAGLATRTQQLADQDLVGKIVRLIDDLQNQLSQAFDLERKAEDNRVTAFNAYLGLLNKDMNKYNTDIANLEAAIQSLNDRLAALQNSKNDVDRRTADKTQQRADRRAECEEAAFDYQQRRASRDQDRGIVSDLIGVLNKNMRELKEYIALRLAAGDNLS